MKFSLFLLFIFLFFSGCSTIQKPLDLTYGNDIPSYYIPENATPVYAKDFQGLSNLSKTRQFYKDLDLYSSKYENSMFKNIDNLNFIINSYFAYSTDEKLYKQIDHWASANEMIERGFKGDCEDLTFAKIYFASALNIPTENIFIGFTLDYQHIFPIFFDGKDYFVSETDGPLVRFEYFYTKYQDLKVYSYDEMFESNDIIFQKQIKEKSISKMLGYVNIAGDFL